MYVNEVFVSDCFLCVFGDGSEHVCLLFFVSVGGVCVSAAGGVCLFVMHLLTFDCFF